MRSIRNVVLALGISSAPMALAAGMPHAMHGEHDHAATGGMMAKPVAWTGYPLLKARMNGENRELVTIVPQNIVADGIDAHSNDIRDASGVRKLPMEMGGARLDKPATGGFHWLSAREERDDRLLVASTVYFFGERGAKNPTEMFMQQKHELEIIPQPFPREHSRYRANEDWKFLVRFSGAPLAGQKVVLETQNGTKTEWTSDAQGVVTVQLPDDFKVEETQKEGGRHGRGMPGSDFVLVTQHVEGGKTYLTAFNSSYGKDAFDQRSVAMGLGFTLLGMIGALPLLRQRKAKSGEADHA